jgi:integrase
MNLPIEQNELATTCLKGSEDLQKFSEQINLLFEKRNKIKNIFKRFSLLRGSSLKDISFRNHHDINHFIRIVDILNDPKTTEYTKHIDSIRFTSYYKPAPKSSTTGYPSPIDRVYKSMSIRKLPIVIKPSIVEPYQSKNQIKQYVEEEKLNTISAITDLIDNHDVDTQVNAFNNQVDNTHTITLTDVTVDTAEDVQNLLTLINAIQNNNFPSASNLANNINHLPSAPKLQHKISTVFDKYLKEKKKDWQTKTYKSNKAILDLFISAIQDLYVEQLNDDHARHWLDVIQRVPANRNKLPQFRDKTVDELLAISDTYQAVSINTSKDYLQVSKAAFTWAKQRRYLPYTFLKDMRFTAKRTKIKKESELRRRFSQEDLNNIFSLPRFTKGDYSRTYQCWFPLLGLYSGARADELAQMELQDVYKEKNIWVMNINDNGDKKLKTINSQRVIPVHKTLIKLGFTKYVEYLKLCFESDVTCTNKLFPELQMQRDGYSRIPRDRFISFLEQNNLKQDDQAFHSFRHTFADNMQNDDIPEKYCAALIGHKHSNITYGRYAKEFAPAKTQKIINSINPLPDSIVKKIKPFIFPIEFRTNSMMTSHIKMYDKNTSWENDKHMNKKFPKIFFRYKNLNHDK